MTLVLPDSPRITELRRRVEADPASTAFVQLAEEYRRLGRYRDAVQCCRRGLDHHPSYLSARVILARALADLGSFDDATREYGLVLEVAPDNLVAVRGLAAVERRLQPPDDKKVDFDALLQDLGTPDLKPPPVMEMLLNNEAPPVASSDLPEVSALPKDDVFGALEQRLRAFEQRPEDADLSRRSTEGAKVADLLAELEAWLSVLRKPRTESNAR